MGIKDQTLTEKVASLTANPNAAFRKKKQESLPDSRGNFVKNNNNENNLQR